MFTPMSGQLGVFVLKNSFAPFPPDLHSSSAVFFFDGFHQQPSIVRPLPEIGPWNDPAASLTGQHGGRFQLERFIELVIIMLASSYALDIREHKTNNTRNEFSSSDSLF